MNECAISGGRTAAPHSEEKRAGDKLIVYAIIGHQMAVYKKVFFQTARQARDKAALRKAAEMLNYETKEQPLWESTRFPPPTALYIRGKSEQSTKEIEIAVTIVKELFSDAEGV